MADSDVYRNLSSRRSLGLRRILCCAVPPPKSPEMLSTSVNPSNTPKPPQTSSSSFPNSPSPINSTKLGLGLGRRMLSSSPGRVIPIDSVTLLDPLPEIEPESEPEISPPPVSAPLPPAEKSGSGREKDFDMRLHLKGKDGRILCLELDSEVLRSSSKLFAEKIAHFQRRSVPEEGCCSIEVGNVSNLEALRETIELMYGKDPAKKLIKTGVSRAIDILEVSYDIMFDMGTNSCLNYLEAVPWCESEEEKLKSLFTRCRFNEAVAQDVLARLNLHNPVSLPLGVHIIESVTQGINMNAKRELKSLVKGLLSSSSVYIKDPAVINKEDLYRICVTCLLSLENCFKEAYDHVPEDQAATEEATRRPLIGLISEQVDNLNWLLEILMGRQMAEDFVGMWANQSELLRMHERASRMVRYELSRVSASIFIALGRGKLQCRGEERYRVLRVWFEPMLVDFGWLQRCSKGLDARELEEAMGQALLTLSLNQQHILFMEWFHCYSRLGRECPNLSKAFQVWCRRIFSRAPES